MQREFVSASKAEAVSLPIDQRLGINIDVRSGDFVGRHEPAVSIDVGMDPLSINDMGQVRCGSSGDRMSTGWQ